MIGTIRKHQTWLWVIIIIAMSIGLVVVFTPAARFSGRGGGEGNYGEIDGERISAQDYRDAQNEAYVRYFVLHGGQWPDTGTRNSNFDATRDTYQWLFIIQKLREYDIHVDDASVAQAAANILRAFGRGHAIPPQTFVDRVLKQHNPPFNANDFERFLRHDLGMEQLISIVGLSGDLFTPQDARALYVRERQELATEAVFFSGSNYLSGVTAPTPKALAQFYTNRMADYRLPDRMQVSYVAFGITNCLPEAEKQLTNLNDLVESNFREIGTNYVQIAKTPEEAKAKIRQELLHRQATADAHDKANAFATRLFDMDPAVPQNLEVLAKTNGLTVKVTEPFDANYGPKEFDGGPDFATRAFDLSPDNPFAQPIVGPDDVYVIAFKKKIPSEIPPLEKIHDKVVEDYRYSQALMEARIAGEAFAQSATNEMAQGKTFAEVCATAKIKPVVVPPFSLSTQELPAVEDYVSLLHYKEATFGTPPGKVSQFNPTSNGGLVVYVQRRLPIDEAKLKEQMPDFVKSVRNRRQQEAFLQWFQRGYGEALASLPKEARGSAASGAGQ